MDYYHGQNQVLINQIEQAAQESSSLRAKLAVEKQISDRSQQVFILKDDSKLLSHSKLFLTQKIGCILYSKHYTVSCLALPNLVLVRTFI